MSENKDYEVGYKKPPKHGQFKKGEPSPNPRGRRKGAQNFANLFREALMQPIVVVEKGVRKRMTAQRVIVQQVMMKAMKGDIRALEQIYKFNPRLAEVDIVKETANAIDAWLDTLTMEELQDMRASLVKSTAENKLRNRLANSKRNQA